MNYNRTQNANHRAREAFKKYMGYYPDMIPEKYKSMHFDTIGENLGIYRKTRVLCSSPFCCGNPRRIRGLKREVRTRQEILADISFNEQLQDLNFNKI